jgi:LmbE family N-acetylglucosaminyl deacetylase
VTFPTDGVTVVVSAHLDDGVFSLGGSIHRATEAGAAVTVATILAGDPGSERPAGFWDAASGFRTEGEAAGARRDEDRRACDAVGATPVWLPYADEQYDRGVTDDEIWERIEVVLIGADLVLVPGFPLVNVDHAWLAALILGRADPRTPLALFLEQPYCIWRRWRGRSPEAAKPIVPVLRTTPTWSTLPLRPSDRRAKRRACGSYRSQLRQLSRWRPVTWRVAADDRRRGGETIGRLTEPESSLARA